MPLLTPDPIDSLTIVQPYVRLGDPHACSDDRHRLSLLHALYEPLIKRAANGHYQAALAESWSVSEGAQHWRFHLREQVRFHDGQLLSSDDVVASLARVRDESITGELGTTGIYQGYLQDCKLEASDAHTVNIYLPHAMADLLDVLVELFILPATRLSELPTLPPGTGPLKLVRQREDEIVTDAHAHYWQGTPAVKRVIWQVLASVDERLEALASARADIASDIHQASENLIQHTQPSSVATTFMFNLVSGQVGDINLRQALNYATDKKTIIDVLFDGHADIISSPCTATQLGFDPDLTPYAYDPGRARQLLDGVQTTDLKLTFDVPSRLPDEALQLGSLLQEQWQHVGVSLELIEHADRPQYANDVRDTNIHDAACFDSSPHSTFRLFSEKFSSHNPGVWWLGYDNADFNHLLAQARTTISARARQQIYRQAAGILRDDPPWLYLYNTRLFWLTGHKARTWRPSVDGLITFTPHNHPL
ncbi:MAG: ABC transporter substrate-binding protein [Deinococcota bacterium]